MTNLEHLEQFFLEADIETINNFIGEPIAIEMNKKTEQVSEKTREFLYRLAEAIRHKTLCQRKCCFRKN